MGGAGLESGRYRFFPRIRRAAARGLDALSQAAIRLTASSMPPVRYIEAELREVALDLAPGQSLMRGAMDACLSGLEAHCGGSCACAPCHCYVQAGSVDKL